MMPRTGIRLPTRTMAGAHNSEAAAPMRRFLRLVTGEASVAWERSCGVMPTDPGGVERSKLSWTTLAAAVAAPELVMLRRNHHPVVRARAGRHPCAGIVACRCWTEVQLPRQCNDGCLMATLFCFSSGAVHLKLLGDGSDDVRQFQTCE